MAEPAARWGMTSAGPGVVKVAPYNYRITLSLGDIDALCDSKTDKAGQQQRLQLIGAFMEPLTSKAVDTRFKAAFKHYAAQIASPPAKEAEAQDALAAAVNSEIVVLDGAAPGAPSSLPQAGQFAKIRIPGGFAIDSERPLWFPVGHKHRYEAEKKYFDANPRLGAIPIVAKVEYTAGPTWATVGAGVDVHFQLLPPDALPAGNSVTPDPLRTETVVKGGQGPKAYIDLEIASHAAQAGDPQADNCVADRGGKRAPGAGSATDYFETSARKGFGSDRPDPFPVATASAHPVAVKAQTNAKGEAGVIFRPSFQGGDRFKLRVFLDPIGPGGAASDGTDTPSGKAVKADTGTLVVWKTLRVSGYHQFDYPAATTAAAKTAAGGAIGLIDFTEVAKGFSRAFVELVVERSGKRNRHVIGDAFWVKWIEFAQKNTPAQPAGVSQRYDLAALFPKVNTTPGLFNLALPAAYDAAKGAAFPVAPVTAATRNADWNALLDAFMSTAMVYFTQNATPGLVVAQAPNGDSITAAGGDLTSSGVAKLVRGCFLFYGSQTYTNGMPYSLNSNTMHEMGHCLFLPHQWTDKNAATGAVAGGVPPEHDYKDYCIMSYQKNKRNFLDYCGRCNLKLRGWDTSKIPLNNK